MGCGSSKSTATPKETHIDPIHVPDTEDGYPPPRPPRDRKKDIFKKEDFAALDAKAKQVPRSAAASYETLIDHLTQGTKNDLEKVRAIFAWMSAQKIYDVQYPGVKDAHSPEGYMKLIKQGDGSYNAFFALLCRAAKLPCVIVRGVGKSAGYEVGQQDVSDLRNSWNAVYVDGQWRLVQPHWAMIGLRGFNKGTWTKVEQSGQAVREKERQSSGVIVYHMNEYWFLTDPDQFIYKCIADRPEWQLLKPSWTLNKFVNVPYFTAFYFESGLKLVSEHAAILRCKKFCQVNFKIQEPKKSDIDYVLFFDEEHSEEQLSPDLQLERYAIELVDQQHKGLQVRFPAKGIYKLEIYGYDGDQTVSFRLENDEVQEDAQPFPINPKIGFGYGQKAEEAGLSKPSHVKGIMVVQQGERIKFQFICKRRVEVQSLLVHKDQSASELAHHVSQDQSADNLTITVNVPPHAHNPEYALQVNVRPEGSAEEFENVANYLLTHGKDTEPSDEAQSGAADLRKELVSATDARSIERLEKAIPEFEKARLPDQGDLTEARITLIALHEQALRDAVNERSLEKLEAAIKAARESCVSIHLNGRQSLTEAETVRDLLRRLKLYMHKILEMKQSTVSEIHSYTRPRPLVHTVMMATYLLLGEEEKQLKKWAYIRALMRQVGKGSIIRKIKDFDIIGLELERVEQAEEHLERVDIDQVRLTSAGAGTFYVWSENIIREGKNGSSLLSSANGEERQDERMRELDDDREEENEQRERGEREDSLTQMD